MAEVDPKSIYLADADRVEKLLDIIQNTVEMPNVPCIRAAAANEVAAIEFELWEQMYPEEAAARKAKEEADQEAEAKRVEKVKKEQEEERQRQEELRQKEEEKEDA